MMPFSSTSNVNRSQYGAAGGFAPQGFGNFYNQQVVKPIRGGGAKGNLDRSSQAINFGEFMDSQNYKTGQRPTVKKPSELNTQNNRFRSVSKPQLLSKKD